MIFKSLGGMFSKKPGCPMGVWLLFFLLSAPQLPGAAGFEEVQSVYQENFNNNKQGVYKKDGLIFVVVEIRDIPKLSTTQAVQNSLRAKTMLKSFYLLKEYVLHNYYPEADKADYDNFLGHPNITELLEEHLPDLAESQFKFSLKTHQLENKTSKELHRYVVAMHEVDLKGQLPKDVPRPTAGQIVSGLVRIRDKLEGSDDFKEIIQFHLKIGAVEDALVFADKSLREDFPLHSYPAEPIQDLAVFYSNLKEVGKLTQAKPTRENLITALTKAPNHPLALEQLGSYHQEQGQPLFAAGIHLFSLPIADDAGATRKMIVKCLSQIEEGGGMKATRQYIELLHGLMGGHLPEAFAHESDMLNIINYVWKSFGHVNFPGTFSSDSSSGYERALKIFNDGGNVSEMIQLLVEAVIHKPRHAESWNLLGRCLMIRGQYLESIPFLCQSNRLVESAMPKVNMAICYDKLGYHDLSSGMALASLMCSDVSEWTRSQAYNLLKQQALIL